MTKHAGLPGFRDFYPEEMVRRQQIFTVWRDVGRRYGFDEYDGPPLEPLELYIEKSGPEIVNQLFNFTDKGGRQVALRPEMTPTVVRMLGARIKGMARPVRWFSTPQLFRYEKQQRGRLREHFQLNMDIVGEESVLADADLLAAALDVLRSLGLSAEDVIARYSDRRLLHGALLELGVPEERLPVAYNVIDKIERDSGEVCLARLKEIGLRADQAEAALSLTSMTADDLFQRFAANEEIQRIRGELETYRTSLDALGFGDYIQFDMKIVRGLAYYTGIVFEIFDRKGKMRAICGGGRYDQLFLSLTGIDVPALGFGFGDVVLGDLLKDRGLARAFERAVDVMVLPELPGMEQTVLRTVAAVRASGRSAIFNFKPAGERVDLGKLLKGAAASGARIALIVGAGTAVKIRDLGASTQREATLEEFLAEARA
jgi:histidyl-tRNA synthetase